MNQFCKIFSIVLGASIYEWWFRRGGHDHALSGGDSGEDAKTSRFGECVYGCLTQVNQVNKRPKYKDGRVVDGRLRLE
jgi:hypothetical protein